MTTTDQQPPTTTARAALHPDLAGVALVDASHAAAAGGMSVSWWHEEVRAGRAPAPAVRKPRCTRWRVADVRQFWHDFAQQPAATSDEVTNRARKASAAAQEKRRAAKAVPA